MTVRYFSQSVACSRYFGLLWFPIIANSRLVFSQRINFFPNPNTVGSTSRHGKDLQIIVMHLFRLWYVYLSDRCVILFPLASDRSSRAVLSSLCWGPMFQFLTSFKYTSEETFEGRETARSKIRWPSLLDLAPAAYLSNGFWTHPAEVLRRRRGCCLLREDHCGVWQQSSRTYDLL